MSGMALAGKSIIGSFPTGMWVWCLGPRWAWITKERLLGTAGLGYLACLFDYFLFVMGIGTGWIHTYIFFFLSFSET